MWLCLLPSPSVYSASGANWIASISNWRGMDEPFGGRPTGQALPPENPFKYERLAKCLQGSASCHHSSWTQCWKTVSFSRKDYFHLKKGRSPAFTTPTLQPPGKSDALRVDTWSAPERMAKRKLMRQGLWNLGTPKHGMEHF